MIARYPILAHKDEGSSWGISFVDLPIHIVEPRLEDALAQCQEAFEEFMRDEAVLPSPSPVDAVAASEAGQEATAVLLADIDTAFFADPTVRKTASAKQSQWEAIDRAARQAGLTRSAFMVGASLERAKGIATR